MWKRGIVSLVVVLSCSQMAAGQQLRVPFEYYALDNGLRVVLSQDRSSPHVAVVVYYDVGSRNEAKGKSGFAHLFEHMMFEGSAHIKKGEHFQLVNRSGGYLNANTNSERTMYYEVLPSTQLALGLWLEADRMASLAVTQENLDNQVATVKEEKKENYDNRPYRPAMLRLTELAYENWAYAHSTIGEPADLDAASLKDVQAFFKTYYRPNNAVLCIVGDMDPEAARAMVEHYFGRIGRGPAPPKVNIQEPAQRKLKFERVIDARARLPALLMAWHVPPIGTPERYALGLLLDVVAEGESSRLHRVLVEEQRVAVSVSADLGGRRGADLLYLAAITRGAPPQAAAKLVLQELERVRREGVTEAELQKVKNMRRSSYVFAVQRNVARARLLGHHALFFDSPGRLNSELGRYLAVTRQDLQKVADKYLTLGNSTTIEVLPRSQGGGK